MITNYYTFSNTITPTKLESQDSQRISFKHNLLNPLTHTNIGSCLEGYIGNVSVRKGSEKVALNVFKRFKENSIENYTIKNNNGDILGNIDIAIKNYNQHLGIKLTQATFLLIILEIIQIQTPLITNQV